MSVTAWITSLPTWATLAVMVVFFVVLSVVGARLTRPYVELSMGDAHNDVGGFLFATVGVVYAVLMAFTVFAVWEQYAQAEQDTSRESAALVSLYRDAGTFNQSDQAQLRSLIKSYIEDVVHSEFPTMQTGKSSPKVDNDLNNLFHAYSRLSVSGAKQTADYQESVGRLNEVTALRELRIRASGAALPQVFYVVLLLGGLLTIAFSWLFHMEKPLMQAVMAALLGALIAIVLFLVVAIDHPFTGDVAVHADSFERALVAVQLIDLRGG